MTRHLPALALYALLTIALTWPLAMNLAGVMPFDLGDPLLSTWILWWNARVVPFTQQWWDGLAFFPANDTLTFSDHRVGLSLITTPLIWSGASPVTAYNIAFLLSFLLSATAAYALCFALTRSRTAAFIGGFVFGFNPFRAEHLTHLELLSSYWLPLMLLALHQWVRTQSLTSLFLLFVSLTMQALTSGYYFFFAGVLVLLWIVWFVPRGLPLKRYLALGLTLVLPLVLIAPILFKYRQAHREVGLSRSITDIEALSADVIGLFTAPTALAVWNTPPAWQRVEGALMPGVTVIILIAGTLLVRAGSHRELPPARWAHLRTALLAGTAIAVASAMIPRVFGPVASDLGGVRLLSISRPYKPLSVATVLFACWFFTSPAFQDARKRRSSLAFYLLATGAMWLLAFGPVVRLLGHRVLYKPPYAWLMMLPGFKDEFRVPARFAMLAVLTLSVAAALAFLGLVAARSSRFRLAAACCIAAGIALDSWIYPFNLATVPAPLTIPSGIAAEAVILELPMGVFEDATAMYRSTIHGRRTVNGMSGYEPPHYPILRAALAERSIEVLSQLAAHRDIAVFVSRDAPHVRRLLASRTMAKKIAVDRTHDVFLLPRSVHERPVSSPHRTDLPVQRLTSDSNPGHLSLMTDRDRLSTWSTLEPQRGDEQLIADLGRIAEIDEVRLALGPMLTAFPRVLVFDVSVDGAEWTEVWRGPTAPATFTAAIDDPRDVAVPFSFSVQRARYVRMRQIGQSTERWVIAELRIAGPP